MDNEHDAPECFCAICRHNHSFELPIAILDAVSKSSLVIFAGAGVSTESRIVFPWTFYEDICGRISVDPRSGPPFPDAMAAFCSRPNGRAELLGLLQERIQYVRSFPELYDNAVRFHRELAGIWQIKEIITTNWDDFFEQECGALPLVTDEDFAFWSVPRRRVLKIHGSLNNLGSIVITRDDYNDCSASLASGVLGACVKMHLATKTILFVGYSVTDEDFLQIYNAISSGMKGLKPEAYVVTLDTSSKLRFESLGIKPIFTDGTHFLSVLKSHLVEAGSVIPDARFDSAFDLLDEMVELHSRLFIEWPARKHPDVLLCAVYQDGVIHALQRLRRMWRTGEYSHECFIAHKIKEYAELRNKKSKQRKDSDVAYIDGYMNGLMYLLAPESERKLIPRYFVFGSDDQPRALRAYKRLSRHACELHPAAYRYAEKMVPLTHADQEGIAVHHSPFLL